MQSPLAIASNLVLPISTRGQGQPNMASCRLSEVHLQFTHAYTSRQITTRGGGNVTFTHCFHPHAAAFAFPRQVDTYLSMGGAVIAGASILASPIRLSAALTANFDMFGPPSDVNALVPTHDAAPTWALIVTL